MRRPATASLLIVVFMATSGAAALEPSVLAPFRFQPAQRPLSTGDESRALLYRNELQSLLRTLDRESALRRLGSRDERLLLDTRGEAQRLDRVLREPAGIVPVIPQSAPLPSLSTGIGRGSP